MENNFSQPQKQSLIGVVVMFADTFQLAIRTLWPLLIVWLFKLDQINKTYLILGSVSIFFLVAFIAYLKYLNFTFFLDENNQEFVIRKGILNKSRIAIPLDKIQQVNISQSLIQKFIGVHALEVDTAGSSDKEVTIKAITHELALELKNRLLDGVDKPKTIESINTAEEKSFINISFVSLLKTGITSNYVRSFALLLAFFITTLQYVEDIINAAELDKDPLDDYINPETFLKFIGFILIAIIVLTLLVNLSRTILKFFDFRIAKKNNSLLLSHGLLNTRNIILRPEKVQIVTIGRNYFQKKLDVFDIKVKQASSLEASEKEKRKSAIEIPGCNTAEKDMIIKFLLEELPQKGFAVKPNIRKLIIQVIKFLLFPLSTFFIIAFNAPEAMDYVIFTPFYLVFVGVILYFGYRNSRLFINDKFIIKQSGAWDIDRDYIAPHKIQGITLKQYFWQIHSKIGIVTLHTAGGDISFGVANFSKLKELTNYWLYQVETTSKNWM